jgi:DnaJ-class molecular chaperone
MMRLRERGLAQRHGPAGDLFVRVQVTIPQHIDADLLHMIQEKKSNNQL